MLGYVQAGGASSRFGRDKALVKLGGVTMLERMCGLLRGVCASVAIVAPSGRYEIAGARRVEDRWPGEGPLGGILTALLDASARVTDSKWTLIVSCDMPFLTNAWLAQLTELAERSAADVAVPRSPGGLEPLCACWRTSAAIPLRNAFEEGVRKVSDGLQRLTVEVLDEPQWKRFDTAGRLFWNMNTPRDFEEARRLWAQGQS
jgi:molybdopterin-guanine dinucleotide biosynthesis protein A